MSNRSANSTQGKKKAIYRKKQRRTAAFLALLFLIVLLIGTLVFVILWVMKKQPAADVPDTSSASSSPSSTTAAPREPLSSSFVSFIDANTTSRSIVLYDLTADTLLYSKMPDLQEEPASLTKLMTAALAIRYAPEGYVFTVGEERGLVPPNSSLANLSASAGDKLDLDMILEALLIPSGNDAAYTIAAHIGRIIADNTSLSTQAAIDTFVTQMNATAAELGMTNTHFANPDGSPQKDHYSTASDLLKLTQYALTFPQIVEIAKMPTTTVTLLNGRTITWNNSNQLIQSDTQYYNPYATGLKTGTGDNGYCLAATAEKDGRQIAAIVLGAPSNNERWTDASGLLSIALQF